ncbi:ABC transporter ATP-binding protein [Rapidithrix thailandica]|uniref:ABC transporter ATP-binding protein n=1 Tax=Rapidithrix thailandica TaxID=413964 RepID=A0AAW9S0C4_9BACT
MESDKELKGNVFDFRILKRIFAFVKPYRGRFFFLVFLTIFLGALAPTQPYLIKLTIDNYIAVGNMEGLTMMVSLLFGIAVLQAIVQYFHTYLSGWLGQYIVRDIRNQLYQHIQRLRLQFFDNTPIGKLVTRVVSDTETLLEIFTNGLAAIIGDLLQLVFILGFMLIINWKLALVSLATFPIMLLATYIFKEKIKKAFSKVRNAVSNLNTFVQEHITGMNIVQIFNSEEKEYAKFKKINKEHLQANLQTVNYYSIYFPVAEVIAASATGLLVWYGARGVIQDTISLGDLIAFIMYISLFFRPLRMIADRFNTLQLGIVSSNRILNLLDNHEHIQDNGIYSPKNILGKVQFDNIWFAYKEDDYVLKDINFEVKQGETLALVGATGAGKSSVINLLSRFYEINKGQIFVDDIPLTDYNLPNLRKHIGVVLQDVFLFSDTIEQNITLGNKDISHEKVREAAEYVGALQFIEKLPGGFQYNVMERGATLSVGQRQMISFVRALVYDPKIIVLDEATSSVDTETEEMIQAAMEKLMKGRTSIVIAHRLATIQKADKILVLDKGEIKEAGTHESLLEQEGLYAQLYEVQYKSVV